MRKLKPIDGIAEDVMKGDLVRFRLLVNPIAKEYAGYCYHNEQSFLEFSSVLRIRGDFLTDHLRTPTKTLKMCSDNYDREFIVKGYEILRRAKKR